MAVKRGVTHAPYPAALRVVALRELRQGSAPAIVARELGVPTTTLKAWQRSAAVTRGGRTHTRAEVIARANDGYAATERLIAGLSPRDWRRPLLFAADARDRWTVKDAIAHLTYWRSDVARIARAERRSPQERRAIGSDPSHFVFLRFRDLTPEELVAYHRDVQRELIAALRAAPDSWFTSKKASSWWPPNVDHHPAQHVRDVERALGMSPR